MSGSGSGAGSSAAGAGDGDGGYGTGGRDSNDETEVRLKDLVQSNLVTVYQNYYGWPGAPPPVQGVVPVAGVLTEPPQGAAAFSDPVPGLGMPAIPFSQWPAASPQSVPQAAHTVPTEQANVQILPESSDQLVTETKDTHPQTTSKLVTIEQTAKVQPLVEESRLLTQQSSLGTEEQQQKVDNEPTMDHSTVHKLNDTRDESRNEGAALLAACVNSEWDMAKALVKSGSVLEARSNPDRKTPLLHTCIKGEIAFVEYLVQHGADIAAEDSYGRCCLHFHEVLRNEVLMKYLLVAFTLFDHSIDMPDENKCTPLLVACTLGDSVVNSVRLLLDHEANPDGNSHAQCRPLVEASAHGHEQTVKLLLQYNANPDIQDVSGCTALLKACNCRQSNIIRLLLEHGVSVNHSDHDGTTPLFSAISSNAHEVVEQLIQKGAHVNTTRYRTNPMMSGAVEETPLAHACAKGFLDIVELLVLYGADLNYLCSGTVPPLGFAVICKQMHIVKYLLRINKSLNGLRAPIVIAVKVQNIAYARVLIAELGGEEKALKMANQENMYQLAEHIELYMALKKDFPDSLLEETDGYNPVPAHVQDPSYYKTGKVMQSFAEVCVAAVSSVVAKEDTASVITHLHQHAGEFLYRCTNGTQDPETLRRDLLSGNPSPFKFFIDNKLLTADNFQIQAFARYGDHASKFCDELMQMFRQMPGGQSLPNDIYSVLMRIFSGQLGIGYQVTSSRSGRDSLPQELWPWWDSKYRSLMRQSQQSSMPQSASRSEECPDRYTPSTPQLEAQSTAAPTTTPVPPLHNHSKHSENQEAKKQNTIDHSAAKSLIAATGTHTASPTEMLPMAATDTHTGLQGVHADFSVPDDQTWKQMVINDLCGGKYEVNGAAVLNKLLLDFYHYLNTPALVKYLVDKCLLTDGERWALTEKPLGPQEKTLHLQQILMKKGEDALIEFYQCLLESYGLESALAGHYTLVQIIKRKVRFHDCSDMAELLQQEREPVQVVRQVKVVPISSETARSLIQKLHLEECNMNIENVTTQDIAKNWLATDKTKDWKVLVEALIMERGCGCSVSGVLPLSESNPPEVWHFIRRLNRNWAHFAKFLGFPSRLICDIQIAWHHDPMAQIKSFMRMSLIPDCGDEKTRAIIQQIAHHMPVSRDPLISTKAKRSMSEDEKEDLPSEAGAPSFDGWGAPPGSVIVWQFEDFLKGIKQQKHTGASRVYQGGAALITGSKSDLYADDETVFSRDNSAGYDTLHTTRYQAKTGESDLKSQDVKAPELTVSRQQSLGVHSAAEDDSGRDILQACIHGRWDFVKQSVSSRSNLEACSKNGRTALHICCIKGNIEIVILLLQNGADVTTVDNERNCCLHFRETLKCEDLVRMLVEEFKKKNTTLDQLNKNGLTPLMVACLTNSVLCTKSAIHLLTNGAAVDGPPDVYSVPLIHASAVGNKGMVETLILYGANINKQDQDGSTALIQACLCNHTDIALMLLEAGTDVNKAEKNGTAALAAAITRNLYEMVQKLLEKGANPNAIRVISGEVEETPLAFTCSHGLRDIAQLLIVHGAKVNYMCSRQVPAIGFAIIGRQQGMVEFMLQVEDFDKSVYGLAIPMHIAMSVENLEAAKIVLNVLGGPQKALELAQEKNHEQFKEAISLFISVGGDALITAQRQTTTHSFESESRNQRVKVQQTLQTFSQICMSAIMENRNHDFIVEYATADNLPHVAVFFRDYFDRPQRADVLKANFLSRDHGISPLNFSIERAFINSDDFQVHALEFFPESPDQFYSDLVWSFHQISGGEDLSWDVPSVLQRLFSGSFSLNVESSMADTRTESQPTSIVIKNFSDQTPSPVSGATAHHQPHVASSQPMSTALQPYSLPSTTYGWYSAASPRSKMSSETRSTQDWELREWEADFSVPDDLTWKQMVINDLCGENSVPDGFNGAAILNKLLLDFYHYLNTPALVKYLVDKCLLTDGERWALTQKPLSPQEKSLLLQQILMKKGENALIEFYQCLLESSGIEPGLAKHYTLAQIIKRKVRFHDCSDVAELLQQEREPGQVVRQIKEVPISSETARSLIHKLHLEECNINIENVTTQDIANHWLATDKIKDWKVLVEALLTERGCGCSVSGVLPLSESNPPEVWHFVRSLNHNWAHFAEFLGFPSHLTSYIKSAWNHDPMAQIKSFMQMCLIPDCGDEKNRAIIQQITHHMPVYQYLLISTKENSLKQIEEALKTLAEKTHAEKDIPNSKDFAKSIIRIILSEDEKEDLPSDIRALIFNDRITEDPVVMSKVEKVIKQQKLTGTSWVYQGGAALITGGRRDLYADDETSELTLSRQQSLGVHSAPEDQDSGRDILQACVHGSWDFVQQSVSFRSNLEACNKNGRTALHICCIKGNTEIAILLFQNGADVTTMDNEGNCCLHFQETLKNGILVEVLVEEFKKKNTTLDQLNKNGLTPLMVACLTNSDLCTRSVIDLVINGAAIDGPPDVFSAPLIYASAVGNKRIVETLLRYGANINKQDQDGSTALIQACLCNHTDIALMLLEAGADVNKAEKNGTAALAAAITRNLYEMVQKLLDKGANPNAIRVISGEVEETPLAFTCSHGLRDIAQLLILHGAKVNYLCSHQVPAIGFAIIGQQQGMVEFMLQEEDFNKSVYGLVIPMRIAMHVENLEAAKAVLNVLGGPQKALELAQERNLNGFKHDILSFIAVGGDALMTSQWQPMTHSFESEIRSQRVKVQQTLQTFSQICMSAIMLNRDHNVIVDYATADNLPHVAVFFRDYFDKPQRADVLKANFLSCNHGISPLNFSIERGILNSDDFQVHALEFFPESPDQFYSDLVWSFHQISGASGEDLSWDVPSVLQHLFSGSLSLNVESSMADTHTQTQRFSDANQTPSPVFGATAHHQPHMASSLPTLTALQPYSLLSTTYGECLPMYSERSFQQGCDSAFQPLIATLSDTAYEPPRLVDSHRCKPEKHHEAQNFRPLTSIPTKGGLPAIEGELRQMYAWSSRSPRLPSRIPMLLRHHNRSNSQQRSSYVPHLHRLPSQIPIPNRLLSDRHHNRSNSQQRSSYVPHLHRLPSPFPLTIRRMSDPHHSRSSPPSKPQASVYAVGPKSEKKLYSYNTQQRKSYIPRPTKLSRQITVGPSSTPKRRMHARGVPSSGSLHKHSLQSVKERVITLGPMRSSDGLPMQKKSLTICGSTILNKPIFDFVDKFQELSSCAELNWCSLARSLFLTPDEIDLIECFREEERCYQMLCYWYITFHEQATYSTLARALVHSSQEDVIMECPLVFNDDSYIPHSHGQHKHRTQFSGQTAVSEKPSSVPEQGIQTHSLGSKNSGSLYKQMARLSKTDTDHSGSSEGSLITSPELGCLRGVDRIIDEIEFVLTDEARSYDWTDSGFKLHTPHSALPAGAVPCRINVKASLSGQYEFPEDSELVSPIYWISTPKNLRFTKPLTVHFQHCGTVENRDDGDLSFVVAKCTQPDLPYKFKFLDGGLFVPYSSYGSISVTHFSGLGIVSKRKRQSYCARTYVTSRGRDDWRVYFIIVKDLDIVLKAVDTHYICFAKRDVTLRIVFKKSEISLDIPKEGQLISAGWKILPRSYPSISKRDADEFRLGQWIPECELLVELKRSDQHPVCLRHQVSLIGAKAPKNYFNIAINPEWEEPASQPLLQQTSQDYIRQDLCARYPAGLEDKPELYDLMNEVAAKIPSKWRLFGIELQLIPDELDSFLVSSPGDALQCFSSVFTCWQKTMSRPYSWLTVVESLKATAVREHRLALELNNKFKKDITA